MATLNERISNFVTWIRPDPDKVGEARSQRDEVHARIKAAAEADGLTVRSTPNSGSFAKATGLRRHMLGGAEHEGQDIDCPFVVAERDDSGDVLKELLARFDGYAAGSYPSTPRATTKSSVKLKFVASKRNFDLVPLLAVEGNDDEQIILRSDGERRQTSVQKHVEFTKRRTAKSRELAGPVTFNDGVRVMKWWREYQLTQSTILDLVPTFLIDLLCAKAFDEASVVARWPETLQRWFDRIHSYAANRTAVTFSDYGAADLARITDIWHVIDPVNGENNVVPPVWSNLHIDELRDWARAARDKMQQAIAYEMRGKDADAVVLVSAILGPSFSSHSEG